jgi:hypothetical protein
MGTFHFLAVKMFVELCDVGQVALFAGIVEHMVTIWKYDEFAGLSQVRQALTQCVSISSGTSLIPPG